MDALNGNCTSTRNGWNDELNCVCLLFVIVELAAGIHSRAIIHYEPRWYTQCVHQVAARVCCCARERSFTHHQLSNSDLVKCFLGLCPAIPVAKSQPRAGLTREPRSHPRGARRTSPPRSAICASGTADRVIHPRSWTSPPPPATPHPPPPQPPRAAAARCSAGTPSRPPRCRGTRRASPPAAVPGSPACSCEIKV